MEEEKESNLKGSLKIISYDCIKKIIEQMEKSIFKIIIGKNQGTGFFSKIPFPNKENMLPVLITNNHIIDDDIICKMDEIIKIDIKNEENIKQINLNNRLKYTNYEHDITIIEIKNEDKINNYLELDDKIINDIINNYNENECFVDKTAYIIQYPDGELSVSYGNIGGIYEDEKYNFQHKCNTNKGSSGSPILNIYNNKVIGIHKIGGKINKGAFLNYSIKEFINQNYYVDKNSNVYKNRINEILLNCLNEKFNLSLKDIKVENCYLIEKYMGSKLFKDLKNLISYYKNKFNQRFFDLNFHQKVSEQMKKNICQITTGYDSGTGFFCKIPFPTKEKMLPVLITHLCIIDINSVKNKAIYLYLENENKTINLNLKNRYLYMNEEYMTTIIEIKDDDKIQNYLELDDNIIFDVINNQDNNNEFIDEKVYIIQYPEGKLSLSYGDIKEKDKENKIFFKYACKTTNGSSGSPILNSKNKVMGMHVMLNKYNMNIKIGIFLYYPIKEFIKQCSLNNNNKEIELKKLNKIDILIEKFNSISNYLGVDIIKSLEKVELPLLSGLSHHFMNIYYFFDLQFNEKVIDQLKNFLFEVKIRNRKCIAFFCKIPFLTKPKTLPVLITSNEIINEDILGNSNETIEINFTSGNHFKNLKLNERIKYTSNIYHISIIEIKEEDKINNYLDLDHKILDNYIDKNLGYGKDYIDITIYMFQNLRDNIAISYGIIKDIYDQDKYKFIHTCFGTEDSYGSPILNVKNEVIGIYLYKDKFKYKYDNGAFIGYPIKEFILKFHN